MTSHDLLFISGSVTRGSLKRNNVTTLYRAHSFQLRTTIPLFHMLCPPNVFNDGVWITIVMNSVPRD